MNWVGVKEVFNVIGDKDYLGMFLILAFPASFIVGHIYVELLPYGFTVFSPLTIVVLFLVERGIVLYRKLLKIKKKIENFMEKRKSEVNKVDIPELALRTSELSLIIGESESDIESALNELWKENKIKKGTKEYYYATT